MGVIWSTVKVVVVQLMKNRSDLSQKLMGERHLQGQINTEGSYDGYTAVNPEQDHDCRIQPWPGIAEAILADVDKNRPQADDARGNEQRFCRMHNGLFEFIRKERKPTGYHNDVKDEHDDVQDEKDTANGVEAMKAKRNCRFNVLVGSALVEDDSNERSYCCR